MTRNAALEQAVLDDPAALPPRAVYADWLQSQGVALGEWAALQIAIGERPSDLRLRIAALAFLEKHAPELLGSGAKILDGLYLGWSGGFIDELRIHGAAAMTSATSPETYLADLLALPAARFVRTIALGGFARPRDPHSLDPLLLVIEKAAPPLLETLVFDDFEADFLVTAGALNDCFDVLPRLRRLGLGRAMLDRVDPRHLPKGLEQLAIWAGADDALAGIRLPRLSELVWIEPDGAAASARTLPTLPVLRRLRLIGARDLTGLLAAFDTAGVLDQLELLDVSYCDLHDAREILDRLRSRCEIIAMHVAAGDDDRAARALGLLDGTEDDGVSWLRRRLETEGRHALAVIPHAGVGLYNASCHAHTTSALETALRLASAASTLPDRSFGASAWGNVGYAHERLRAHAAGELAAREGLLRYGANANFYSILLASLRGQRRVADARAVIPKAIKSITAKTPRAEAQACLLDIVITLDRCGEAKQAVDLAAKQRAAVPFDHRLHAALALARVALGNLGVADRHLAAAARDGTEDTHGITLHALAALQVATGQQAKARAALAKLRTLDYADVWYLDEDPRLVAPARPKPKRAPAKRKPKPKPTPKRR